VIQLQIKQDSDSVHEQDNSQTSQCLLEVGHPIVAIPHEPPTSACCQIEQHVAFVDMNWSQVDGGDQAPQAFFELPQVGRLAHKGGAMHVSHPRKLATGHRSNRNMRELRSSRFIRFIPRGEPIFLRRVSLLNFFFANKTCTSVS